MKWQRITPFEPNKTQQEIWICEDINYYKKHSVEVTFGKPIDIISLKINIVDNFGKKVSEMRNLSLSVYQSKDNLERVVKCPICEYPSDSAKEILNIYGGSYCRCENCSHYFILDRPKEEHFKNFYKTNIEAQSIYADKSTLETRIEQVVIPKAKYVIKQYQKKYGRLPRSILDVGAGSGHFVYACQKLGVSCEGIEISDSGRDFCKDTFNIELLDVDFMKRSEKFNYDIVTFWGVIEHVPYPLEMLKASKDALGKKGMVAVEVPRWDSFSTAVHTALPESVIRHLDPLQHIQCFSDSSLATAFTLSNYEIVAAWYFGMDAYELMTQISYALNDNNVIDRMRKHIPPLQISLDLAKLSDGMVLCGIPQN
jgi:2-polyprenyl-3-methyl-5-hydroxy-6-metoxy-1,4-benzoquinol methylase